MKKKELRYFQNDCINSIMESLKNKDSNPYANCVTGFGKSVVMADLTERALKKGKRVLQLVPNHTLCTQNYEQTFSYVTDKQAVGVCSAKVSKFQTHRQAVIATQTSFLRRRTTSGSFDVAIIDECDMVSPIEGTTYQKIIKSLLRINPRMRIVGLTGSPWRSDQGSIHDKVKNGNVIFTECCYESDIPRLINEGYLSSVKVINTHISVDLEGVKIKGNDYDQSECGVKFDKIVNDAVADFKQLFIDNGIKTALIFASTIANGKRIVEEYGNNSECKLAHGDLTNHERNELIHWLKDGIGNRYLVNVGLYTRGFDFPGLEALVLLRATTSLRLYVQIIGRLLRSHDEKEFGLLADYGTNVFRFGPIDNLTPPKPPKSGEAPKKLCLNCGFPNNLSAKVCKECDSAFIILDDATGKYEMRSKAQILAMKQEKTKISYAVDNVCFSKYTKDGRDMIKVEFFTKDYNDLDDLICSDYICLEHGGSAGGLALAKIKNLMKNPRADWRKIQQFEGGANVKNVLFLLNEYYEEFFNNILWVVTVRNGRFINVVEYLTD
ncbi:MAG: DEAD/DEAH box helicase family protein [Taibaiella sp.]|jgi:DNA repair protein RadD